MTPERVITLALLDVMHPVDAEDAAKRILAAIASAGMCVAPLRLSGGMSAGAAGGVGGHYVIGDPQKVWDAMLSAWRDRLP